MRTLSSYTGMETQLTLPVSEYLLKEKSSENISPVLNEVAMGHHG